VVEEVFPARRVEVVENVRENGNDRNGARRRCKGCDKTSRIFSLYKTMNLVLVNRRKTGDPEWRERKRESERTKTSERGGKFLWVI
jgi:hypothetical protein